MLQPTTCFKNKSKPKKLCSSPLARRSTRAQEHILDTVDTLCWVTFGVAKMTDLLLHAVLEVGRGTERGERGEHGLYLAGTRCALDKCKRQTARAHAMHTGALACHEAQTCKRARRHIEDENEDEPFPPRAGALYKAAPKQDEP